MTMNNYLKNVPKRNKKIKSLYMLKNEMFIIDINQELFNMQRPAALFWPYIDGTRTLEEIYSEVKEAIRLDVFVTKINTLKKHHIIEF